MKFLRTLERGWGSRIGLAGLCTKIMCYFNKNNQLPQLTQFSSMFLTFSPIHWQGFHHGHTICHYSSHPIQKSNEYSEKEIIKDNYLNQGLLSKSKEKAGLSCNCETKLGKYVLDKGKSLSIWTHCFGWITILSI